MRKRQRQRQRQRQQRQSPNRSGPTAGAQTKNTSGTKQKRTKHTTTTTRAGSYRWRTLLWLCAAAATAAAQPQESVAQLRAASANARSGNIRNSNGNSGNSNSNSSSSSSSGKNGSNRGNRNGGGRNDRRASFVRQQLQQQQQQLEQQRQRQQQQQQQQQRQRTSIDDDAENTNRKRNSGSTNASLGRNRNKSKNNIVATPSSQHGRKKTGFESNHDYNYNNSNNDSDSDNINGNNSNTNNSNNHMRDAVHADFLDWCRLYHGIDTSKVEIGYSGYPDYIRAMEDRIDVFCEDCTEEEEAEDAYLAYYRDRVSGYGGVGVGVDVGVDISKGNRIDTNDDGDADADADADNGMDHHADSDSDSDNGNASSHQHSLSKPPPFPEHSLLLDDRADRQKTAEGEYPLVPVRGLFASKPIQRGEVVLSIPRRALWTVGSAIDRSGDAVLVRALGPEARRRHGWEIAGDNNINSNNSNHHNDDHNDDHDEPASSPLDEIPLLAVTLLYRTMQSQQQHNHNHNSSTTTTNSTNSTNHNTNNSPRNEVGPYLDVLRLHEDDLSETVPHLWPSSRLRTGATPGVRRVAREIRRDVVELYDSVVSVLAREHPAVFGRPPSQAPPEGPPQTTPSETKHHNEHHNESDDGWMFSLENFHRAYALINARRWHLPIPDDESDYDHDCGDDDDPVLDGMSAPPSLEEETDPPGAGGEAQESFSDREAPPAATPTDEWVVTKDRRQKDGEARVLPNGSSPRAGETTTTTNTNTNTNPKPNPSPLPVARSFLLPLADLLNFGPPCTRGAYNASTDAFEIVAACDFSTGQELTFWYTDACEDVVVANYGFALPGMVHKCDKDDRRGYRTAGETGHRYDGSGSGGEPGSDNSSSDSHAPGDPSSPAEDDGSLEDELLGAYDELDRLDQHVDLLLRVIEDCHCENQTAAFDRSSAAPGVDSFSDDSSSEGGPGDRGSGSGHAIRDGTNGSGRPRSETGRQRRKEQQQQHYHHQHHHARTRTTPRRHHGHRHHQSGGSEGSEF